MKTFGSLFAGIGGIDLGLERAGWTCCWQVEQDPYCRAVLAKHWPGVQRRRDVRKAGAKHLPPVDLIAGGFPCQDISTAGRGIGIEGARSGLWTEFARIVSELRPSYVLVENVPRLRSGGRGAWMGKVVGDLAALGYDCLWDSVSASHLGAPHRRERLFIVAYATSNGRDSRRASNAAQEPRGRELNRSSSGTNATADSQRDGRKRQGLSSESRENFLGFAWRSLSRSRTAMAEPPEWRPEPPVGRVADGVSARMDRLKGLGNACVPQVVTLIAQEYLP